MNVRTILLWGTLALLLFQPACQNPTEPDGSVTPLSTIVSGTVLRNDNLAPVANAIVFDAGGLARDTSKSNGSFKLTYQLQGQTRTKIIATRSGFGNDTASVTLSPGVDTTIALRLKADSTSPSGSVSSNGAANIILMSLSSDNISIRGTGANETAVLLFEVRDSLGVPIGGTNRLKVNFTILGGPGGEEYVFPVSSDTDPLTGRVTTRVSSGKKAGVLQVVASGTVPGTTKVIKSSPVRITISGGLPVAERFSISRTLANIAGGVYDNLRTSIMVVVGDKEGNPVQAGTAISFTTTGGIIQPNALTNKDGIASVDLISGNPRPQNSVAIVTAKTIGDSGVVIQRSIPILFSGATRVLTPTTTVVVPDSGSTSFEYRVQDPNGFPLVKGTSIKLTVEGAGAGNLELFGDVSKTLEDSNDPSMTLFKATVRDKKLKDASGNVTFKLDVTSANGNVSTSFPGFVLADTSAAPPVFTPSQSGYAASLTLLDVASPQLSVSGTGENESTRLTFVAKDSVGTPIEIRKRAYVTFSISPVGGLGGGEFLFPTADSTDASGRVSTTLNAGTRSGVVQVVARSTVNARTITSSPVRVTISGGLPDANHFTATLSKKNMPGLVKTGALGTVSVQVGDKFGNPAAEGTALYFSTSGGLISATATTDASGQATATIQGGNPAPNDPTLGGPGFGAITVQTVGEGGVAIQKSLPFLFSGAPRVTLTNVPTDTVKIFDGASYDVDYVVADVNGNPVSQGHNVAVTATGQGSSGISLSGDVSVNTPDTQDKANFTRFRFRISDNVTNGGASGEFAVTVTVTGESGSSVRKFYGVLYPPQVATTVPPSARRPAQIAFLGITNSDLYVAGVGNTENAVITYEVRDSLGVPIDKAQKAYAEFGLVFEPNSFTGGGTRPRVIPGADSTDDSGRLRASIVSGTQAGNITVVAKITLAGGIVVQSQPVKLTIHAGFADQAHFTLMTGRRSMGYLNSVPPSQPVAFSVAVGDTFSNPVQIGTAIYFNSQSGIMTTGTTSGGSYTNTVGYASAGLYTVNPQPSVAPYAYVPQAGQPYYLMMGAGSADGWRKGFHWVWAATQGRGGKRVVDSVLVLWCYPPIQVSGQPVATVPLPTHSSSAPITLTIKDVNGNPLPSGTKISAYIPPSDVAGVKYDVNGDFSTTNAFTMPDGEAWMFPGPRVTDFTIYVRDLSTPATVTIGQTVTVEVIIDAPGGVGTRTLSFQCLVF